MCILFIRSLEASAPTRGAVGLSEEAKHSKMVINIRTCMRNYVPQNIIATLAASSRGAGSGSGASSSVVADLASADAYDHTSIYHKFDSSSKGQLSQKQFTNLLYDVGLRIEKDDLTFAFKFFNTKQDGYVSREEFSRALSLTDYEIDILADKIRARLLSCVISTSSGTSLDKEITVSLKSVPTSGATPTNTGSIFAPQKVVHGKNKLKEGRTFGQVFQVFYIILYIIYKRWWWRRRTFLLFECLFKKRQIIFILYRKSSYIVNYCFLLVDIYMCVCYYSSLIIFFFFFF